MVDAKSNYRNNYLLRVMDEISISILKNHKLGMKLSKFGQICLQLDGNM